MIYCTRNMRTSKFSVYRGLLHSNKFKMFMINVGKKNQGIDGNDSSPEIRKVLNKTIRTGTVTPFSGSF